MATQKARWTIKAGTEAVIKGIEAFTKAGNTVTETIAECLYDHGDKGHKAILGAINFFTENGDGNTDPRILNIRSLCRKASLLREADEDGKLPEGVTAFTIKREDGEWIVTRAKARQEDPAAQATRELKKHREAFKDVTGMLKDRPLQEKLSTLQFMAELIGVPLSQFAKPYKEQTLHNNASKVLGPLKGLVPESEKAEGDGERDSVEA